MPFFKQCQPEVDWKAQRVFVCQEGRKCRLPVVQFGKRSVRVVEKAWPSATRDTNTFSGLPVDPICEYVDDDNDVMSGQLFPGVSDTVAAPIQVVQGVQSQGVCAVGAVLPRQASIQVGDAKGGSCLCGSTCNPLHTPSTSKGGSCMHVSNPSNAP